MNDEEQQPDYETARLATRRLVASLPQEVRRPWERTNHAGRPVTLLEGPAWLAGAVTGIEVAAFLEALDTDERSRTVPRSSRGAALLVTVASGALGVLDDLAGSASRKGLKGHLGARRRGELTTGAVKIAGLAVTGLAGALLTDRDMVENFLAERELEGAMLAAACRARARVQVLKNNLPADVQNHAVAYERDNGAAAICP